MCSSDLARSEHAVHAAAVESDPVQGRLEFRNVLTTQVRRTFVENPVTERPRGLDQRGPHHVIDDARGRQTECILERDHRSVRARAERRILGRTRGEETRTGKPSLEVMDSRTTVARANVQALSNRSTT